jgi:AcrR family transcriptional regulator
VSDVRVPYADCVPRLKQRTPALREQVLTAAVELLSSDGVGAFTTRRVARLAGTSTPAVYELFGDKEGLLRAVFFEGFRLLRVQLAALSTSEDPRADLLALAGAYRIFLAEHGTLAEVMFSRPFTEFAPGRLDAEAVGSVRTLIVARVRRCIEAGQLAGDETDIAHALVALTQGLAAAESTGRLGGSAASIERRWALAINALLAGLSGHARG